MSTEDISMVGQVLLGVTNPDKEIRTKATNKLQELRQNLGALSYCLLEIASLPSEGQQEKLIKTTSLVILRKILDIAELKAWQDINNDLKQKIKSKALEIFLKENDFSAKSKIGEVIIQIVDKVIDNDEQWEDFNKMAEKLFNSPIDETTAKPIEATIKLVKGATGFLFDRLESVFPTMFEFLKKIFASNFTFIKVEASSFISELISYSEKEETNVLKGFLLNILQTTLECFNANNEEGLKTQIQTIIEISSIEPKMISPQFNDLFILSEKIYSKKDFDDEKIRELGFEMIVNLIEEIPSLIKEDTAKLRSLFESLYKFALEMDKEIEPSWEVPTGNNYEDVKAIEEENIQCTQGMIDRLIECLGIETSTSVLMELINGLIMADDWTYKYIGLYSICGLSQYEEEMSTIEVGFKVIFGLVSHENPKVRFAAIHAINEFSTNYNPNFQKKYIDPVIPLLMDALQKEKVLRNSCEIVESITSFIQFTLSENILPHVPKLFELLFGIFLQDIQVMLRKSVLECILEIVTTIEEECKPYAAKSFDIILKYYIQYYQQKSNKILYGALIECITSMGPYAKEEYYKVIPDIVKSIIELVQGINFDNDPIRQDLENSLEKLLPVLQENFKELLPGLVQTVFTLISYRPKMSISSTPENELNIDELLSDGKDKKPKQIGLGTSELEDLAGSLSLLNTIIQSLEGQFTPYIDTVEKEVLPLLTYQFNSKIRNKVAKILPNIVSNIEDPQIKAAKGKIYIQKFIEAIEKETDYQTTTKMYNHFKDLIDYSGTILNKNEVNQLFQKLLQHFENVEKKRIELNKKSGQKVPKKSDDDDEDDEDIGDLIKEDIENLEDIQSCISDTIGVLFKTHKDLSDDIVQVMLTKILPKYLGKSATTFESKMALYIADDMIEFLGMEKLSNVWDNLFKILTSLAGKPDDAVRQAACYGLGVFAQHTKGYEKYAAESINALRSAMKYSPKKKDEEEEWGLAHDNTTAAFGKIMFYQHECETVKSNMNELVEVWIENMPIKYDTTEQEQQHEWLSDMCLLKRELIPAKCFPAAFKALAKIYNSKMSNSVINEKIQKTYAEIGQNAELRKVLEDVYQSAETKVKKKMEKLIK